MRDAMDGRERARRPIRNKRCNRRACDEERKPPKRLFTPEIKRFLKDWLVRRRDNPYPNRDEKKTLAIQTGLTYIQVCNWFANWRRKLKNAGKEPQRKTWGHLIKTYNSQVQGNVEHFSICSDDSIWHEGPEKRHALLAERRFDDFYVYEENYHKRSASSPSSDRCYANDDNNNRHEDDDDEDVDDDESQQCFYVSSTTCDFVEDARNPFVRQQQQQQANKYKSHIMEKYLRDCQRGPPSTTTTNEADYATDKPSMISKWLESAANFKPCEKSYLNWPCNNNNGNKSQRKRATRRNPSEMQHGREELDAAEALTKLANAYGSSRGAFK